MHDTDATTMTSRRVSSADGGRVAQPVDLVVDRRCPSRCRCRSTGCTPRAGSSRSTRRSTRPGSRGRTRGTRWPAGRRATCWARARAWAAAPARSSRRWWRSCREPVMPSRVWNRSPRSMPSASCSMACGWSPAGSKSETTVNGGTDRCYRGGVTLPPGGESAVRREGADPLPHFGDPRLERVSIPRVVDHDVRFCEPVLP